MRYSPNNSISDSIFYVGDVVSQQLSKLVKSNPRSLVDIETIQDDETIVMSDGSLVSAINIQGVSKAVLEPEFEEILDMVERKLQAYMSDGGHYISFYFLRDKDGIDAELDDTYGPVRHAAKKMELEMDDLIEEQQAVMKKYCQKERSMILMWSNMSGLSKDEKRLAGKKLIAKRKGMPLANDAQRLEMGADIMLTRHKSFVTEFKQDLKQVFIATDTLDVHQFLREIRLSIDPAFTAKEWLPSLPGDPIPLRLDNRYKPDISGMLWPRLNEQLFPRAAEHLDHATIKIGDIAYAPVTIELMPKSPEPFQAIFKRLNGEQIPWRMHTLIRNDGLSVLSFKELLASYMQFTPGAPENKYLVDVKKQLMRLRDRGEEIVKLQISFCTWAPANNIELLEWRKATLARCIQGWGTCEVAPAEGDPLESTICSTPGAVLGSIANTTAAPLYDALKMSPLTRPASPWKSGSQPLRTPDGKIMPYQPYSKLQTAWIALIFAPMGYGKSVFMNYSNLSLILSPENTELPYISIIDIGPSSRGLISLIRGALPKEQKHLAMYERMLNTREYCVNTFDTRLGLRRPLENQKSFLINLLCYLATPDDKESPPDGVSGMAEMLIELAYQESSDRKSAKEYQPDILPETDKVLESLGFAFTLGKTKWWDVVDFLYSKNETHQATLAQRYAVPNLENIAQLAKDSRIESVYGQASVQSTTEALPQFFWRKLTEAINKYPVIAEETKFDLGEARIVSLDLDEVAKGQGSDAKRRLGLMYMIAYYTLTNRFFTGKEHLGEMDGEVGIYNVDYRPYHERHIESIKKMPKRFCIDEKHRIKGLQMVENQMDTSIVEGRKWKVEIMQASQLPDDFSEKSVRLATSVWILGGGSKANCAKVAETFKLSPTMIQHLNESLKKPSKAGATLLALLETGDETFEQLLMSTQGPTFLWACNSSSDDAYVRDTLAAQIGDIEARKLLVELYPAGNLDDEIEKRKQLAGLTKQAKKYQGEDLSNRVPESDETPQGILNDILQDLKATFESQKDKNAA